MALLTALLGWQAPLSQMGWFFTQAALVTFGGAYAVLPFVAKHSLEVYGWLNPAQMIDGLALGETTPGPLIMVVSFVGFVGGFQTADMGWTGAVLGCLIATWFTFLPSFVFILLGAPLIEGMRGELRLTALLSGITAAVVGAILHLAVFFGRRVFLPDDGQPDVVSIAVAAAAFVALWRFKADVVLVVLGCGVLGLVFRLLAQ